MIGRSGERGSGISVLVARHDDDDDTGILKIHFFTHVGSVCVYSDYFKSPSDYL